MPVVETFSPKQPWEEFYLGIDFTDDLNGEAIASAVVTVVDSSGQDLSSTLLDEEKTIVDGNTVLFWFRGGEHQQFYSIAAKATGVTGSQYERDATIIVRVL